LYDVILLLLVNKKIEVGLTEKILACVMAQKKKSSLLTCYLNFHSPSNLKRDYCFCFISVLPGKSAIEITLVKMEKNN